MYNMFLYSLNKTRFYLKGMAPPNLWAKRFHSDFHSWHNYVAESSVLQTECAAKSHGTKKMPSESKRYN